MAGMEEAVQQLQERVRAEKTALKGSEEEVRGFKERSADLNARLNDVVRRISEAHGETNETRREQVRREALENLKRVFPDKVHGRLVELCTPSHKKYSIAVTKASGRLVSRLFCCRSSRST